MPVILVSEEELESKGITRKPKSKDNKEKEEKEFGKRIYVIQQLLQTARMDLEIREQQLLRARDLIDKEIPKRDEVLVELEG